jgi:hypothetical protein
LLLLERIWSCGSQDISGEDFLSRYSGIGREVLPGYVLPATNRGISVAAVCKTTPKMNTTEDTIKASRLPSRSAIGAAKSAPKKVPAERIETISDD